MTRALQVLQSVMHCPVLTDRTVAGSHAFPGTAQAALWFFSFGLLRTVLQGSTTACEPDWAGYRPQLGSGISVGDPYEIRLTVLSGSAPQEAGSDAIDTWLPLSSGNEAYWGLTRSSLGANAGSWLVEIRSAATLSVCVSAIYSMSASVISP